MELAVLRDFAVGKWLMVSSPTNLSRRSLTRDATRTVHFYPQGVLYLARPIRGPRALAANKIDELPGDHPLYLLARVQLIVPSKAVRAGIRHAVAACGVAVVRVAVDVERCRAVQVGGRVVVDISHLWQTYVSSLTTRVTSKGSTY